MSVHATNALTASGLHLQSQVMKLDESEEAEGLPACCFRRSVAVQDLDVRNSLTSTHTHTAAHNVLINHITARTCMGNTTPLAVV